MAKRTTDTREWLQRFRLIDDDFMNISFTDVPCVELVLRVILNKPDLTVESVKVQNLLKGPGRSVYLDIDATLSGERRCDIELQRAKRGANLRRARFHSSILDTWSLKRRQGFSEDAHGREAGPEGNRGILRPDARPGQGDTEKDGITQAPGYIIFANRVPS